MRYAQVVWSDNSITGVNELGVNIGTKHFELDSNRLRIRNGSNPDPTPLHTPPPQPVFMKELLLWTHTDETIPMTLWGGARYLGDEMKGGEMLSKWLIISPTDKKQWPLPYPLNTYQEYAAAALYACLEGGKKIVVPITKKAAPLGPDPSWANVGRMADVLNLDNDLYLRHQAVYDHFFQYIFKLNADSNDVTVPHGHRNMGAMLNPFLFAERTGISSDSYADYANIWQIGTREMGVSNRVEFYWYVRAWLICAMTQGDVVSYGVARFLGMMKDAHGFIETDAPHRKNGRWCGEHSFGGVLGDADAKQFHDHDLLKILWPADADIVKVADLAREKILGQPFWNGGGGARNCGNTLENLWYMWKASGDDRLKVRAHAEIANLFVRIVKGNSFFQENPNSWKCSGGEGVLLLRSCFRWVVDGGGDVSLLPKLRFMLQNYLNLGGRWVGPSMWQACYNWSADGDESKNDWGDNIIGNRPGGYKEQGIFWVGLRKYADPAAGQLAQFDAIEKYTYARFATIKGADDDGWGSGICKWLSIFINSLCQ